MSSITAATSDIHTYVRPLLGAYEAKKCTERVTKERMPLTYPADVQDDYSAFMLDLFENGNRFEDEVGALLAEQTKPGEILQIVENRDAKGRRTREGKRLKEEQTFAGLLDPSVRGVFNARIGPRFAELLSEHLGYEVADLDRISEPDLIVFGDMLPTGLRAVSFIDVKWHKIADGRGKTPKPFFYSDLAAPYPNEYVGVQDFYGAIQSDDWIQLAHYYRHGQTLGLVAPGAEGLTAGVIGKELIVVWENLETLNFRKKVDGRMVTRSALETYDQDFARALLLVDRAIERDVDKSLVALSEPEKKTACAGCPFATVCTQEMEAVGKAGHITLLAGLTVSDAAGIYPIRDIYELAQQDPTVGDIDAKQVYAARVRLEGHPHLKLDTVELDLPTADVMVDFDCESDGLVYMWGVLVNDHDDEGVRTGTREVTFDDYTKSEDGERDAFVATWTLFGDLTEKALAEGKTIAFYHYSAYERTQMLALAKKYQGLPGVPTAKDVEQFYAAPNVVDLYTVARTIVWPTSSLSIKKLATYAGFSWRDETPGGDMSIVWYRAAANEDLPLEERHANRDRLRQYNIDDVRAQHALRSWLVDNPLTSVTVLQAPTGA